MAKKSAGGGGSAKNKPVGGGTSGKKNAPGKPAGGQLPAAKKAQKKAQVKAARKSMREGWSYESPNTPTEPKGAWQGYPGPDPQPGDTTVGGGTVPTSPPAGGGGQTPDAWVVADSLLSAYGFTADQRASLRNQLWGDQSELKAYVDTSAFEGMLIAKLYDTAEFKARFPAIDAQRQAGSQNVWSPQMVLDYETQYDLIMPQGTAAMFDRRKTITDLILGGVNTDELRERVEYASWASATAPKEVRDVLAQRYGVTAENLAGFYLDPQKGEEWLSKQTTTAAIRAAGLQAGIDLSWDWADRAGSTLGGDYRDFGTFSSRLQQAAGMAGLSSGLGATVTAEQRAEAALLDDAKAQGRIAGVAAQRTGRFNTSGGAAESQRGVTGLKGATST